MLWSCSPAPDYKTAVYSTEITDKNGVELFDGDNIKLFNEMAEIVFHNGAFGYWPYSKWKFLPFASHDHLKFDKNGRCNEIEKIGSKYENRDD